MRPPKPAPPDGIETRGLVWRPRKTHWRGYWIARQDLADNGYPIKSRPLWPPANDPTAAPDWASLSRACDVLQDEMLKYGTQGFGVVDCSKIFNDTIESLVKIYLTHKNSPYKKLRHHVQVTYSRRMAYIVRDFGQKKISTLTLDDFTEMHDFWLAPTERSNGKRRVSHAHEQMVFVRQAFRLGKGLKLAGCRDAKDILDEMEFPNGKRRKTIVNDEQVRLIRSGAHARGKPSIALVQTLQDCLIVRQKDVLGEYIPLSDPGMSDVHSGREKWVIGFRWEELDEHMVLRHRISKSIRGRDAVADLDEGEVKEWSLPLYPPIMDELALISGVPVASLTRDKLPASGPMVVAEHNGKPWRQKVFATNWRKIARAVGIPDNVQSRDTRAGGATDAERKGADIEKVRQALGHSKPETTRIYERAQTEATAEIAILRFGKKAKDIA